MQYKNRLEADGIPIGNVGEPKKPVVEILARRGIVVSPLGIRRIRTGITSGESIAYRNDCASVLGFGNAETKDLFYMQLGNVGLDFVLSQISENGAGRLSGAAIYKQIESKTGLSTRKQWLLSRAQRMDMVFGLLEQPQHDFEKLFKEAAVRFIGDFTDRKLGEISPAAEILKKEWDGRSVETFYRTFYGMSENSRGVWVPYEQTVLPAYFEGRINAGSPFSVFDKKVLRSGVERSDKGLVEELIRWSGLKVDRSVLQVHRYVLVYGKPSSLSTSL